MNRTAAAILMFIAYTTCLVIEKPNNSKGASKYWDAKAEKMKVDNITNIIFFSILGAFFGIPVAFILLVAIVAGLCYPFHFIHEKFSKKKKSEECSLEC